jgi:EpsI family protein
MMAPRKDLARRAALIAGLMAAASATGIGALAAINRQAQQKLPFSLGEGVPRAFGGWREVAAPSVLLVNPQQEQLLNRLYSQTLSRTYADAAGVRVMLSIAYGGDQRGGLEAHMPELCYPAQGFAVHKIAQDQVRTTFGDIPAKRLSTSLGPRNEPITYWFVLGGVRLAELTRFQKRMMELRLGLTGRVPDGLLFRVSSIDNDPGRAYAAHDRFAQDLLAALPPPVRSRLSGL